MDVLNRIAIGQNTIPVGVNIFADQEVRNGLLELSGRVSKSVVINEIISPAEVDFRNPIAATRETRIYKAIFDAGNTIQAQKESVRAQYMLNEVLSLLILNQHEVGEIFEAGGRESKKDKFTLVFRMPYFDNRRYFKQINFDDESEIARFFKEYINFLKAVYKMHEQGIVHRDLKPKNIILIDKEFSTSIKIIDLELSKITRPDLGVETGKEVDSIVGTIEYMPPEQASGNGFQSDSTSDVYSSVCILYEVLSGQLPLDFSNLTDSYQKISVALSGSVRDIRDLNPLIQNKDFAKILQSALNKYKTSREFKSAKDLLAFMEKLDPYKLKHNIPLNV